MCMSSHVQSRKPQGAPGSTGGQFAARHRVAATSLESTRRAHHDAEREHVKRVVEHVIMSLRATGGEARELVLGVHSNNFGQHTLVFGGVNDEYGQRLLNVPHEVEEYVEELLNEECLNPSFFRLKPSQHWDHGEVRLRIH